MKRIVKYLSVLFVLFVLSISVYGQSKSDGIKPKWVSTEIPDAKSDTYIFVKAYAEGSSLEKARKNALVNLNERLERERNIHTNISSQKNEVCRAIDEYWVYDRGAYKLHVLYTVPKYMLPGYSGKLGTSYDDEVKTTTRYGAGAGLMSVIPGVGQFYKGSVAKGTMFMGLEVIAAVGVVLTENTRASYIKKAVEQPKHAKEYYSRADSWENVRNITIGVAGAVYVWNLIDAFAAKGARRVLVKKGSNGRTVSSLDICPTALENGAGIGFTYRF